MMSWYTTVRGATVIGGALVVVVGAVVLINFDTETNDSAVEQRPSTPASTTTASSSTTVSATTPVEVEPSTSTEPPAPTQTEPQPLDDEPISEARIRAFEDALWIVGTPEHFENDKGTIVADRASTTSGGSIVRSQDGTVFMVLQDRLVAWKVGSAGPQLFKLAEPARSVVRAPGHDILALSNAGTTSLLSGEAAEWDYTFGQRTLVAKNGLSVVAVPATIQRDGYTVVEPGHLQLFDVDGLVVRDWPLGSLSSPHVLLDDFDGQRILVSRHPAEPVAPHLEFFVIDTQCAACTDRFSAMPGSGSLAGRDVEAVFDSFDLGDLVFVQPGWMLPTLSRLRACQTKRGSTSHNWPMRVHGATLGRSSSCRSH